MLILSRRIGQCLIIADNIKINVLEIQGNQVRLGIEAPREVAVHREEIYTKIQAEKNACPGTANS
jgi:carbon storage regulator